MTVRSRRKMMRCGRLRTELADRSVASSAMTTLIYSNVIYLLHYRGPSVAKELLKIYLFCKAQNASGLLI